MNEAEVAAGVAAIIGLPLDTWENKCYRVCMEALHAGLVPGGKLATGYYHSDDGDTVTDHGWVVMSDGRIWDPTRWCIEEKTPNIYIGPATPNYDEDGVRWHAELETLKEAAFGMAAKLRAEFEAAFRGSEDSLVVPIDVGKDAEDRFGDVPGRLRAMVAAGLIRMPSSDMYLAFGVPQDDHRMKIQLGKLLKRYGVRSAPSAGTNYYDLSHFAVPDTEEEA